MNHRLILFLILGLDALVLILQTSQLSISYGEASLLYGDTNFLQIIIKYSISLFGQNDFGLRLPMIVLHISSALLLYSISQEYVKNPRNRIWLILIFVLLPGVMSSAIVVNSAGLTIFSLFLFVYVYQRYSKNYVYFLLSLFSLIDADFLYLFLALIVFSFANKDRVFLFLNLFLAAVSIYLFGLEKYSMPSGHFLDSLAIYSAVFTPIIFIYLFYVLYRRALFKEMDILWYIAAVPLLYSLMLSFRQHIAIEEFAPYLMLSLPLAAKTFYSSYRVRLKNFRTNYRNIFTLSLLLLILNSLVVLFNKELYPYMRKPQKHFAYKMHVAKELAQILKDDGIECISSDAKMSKRLKFYGIKNCNTYSLVEKKPTAFEKNSVTVSYNNRVVYMANVTNINNR